MRTQHTSTCASAPQPRQAGITLLLTILILAALSTIVFGLAAVTLNEIRTSADVALSDPVITADEAVNEDAMYAMVRGSAKGTISSNCGSPSTFTVNGVAVSACALVYYPDPYTFSVPAGSKQTFQLFNPSDWEGTSCSTHGTNCPGYTSVSIVENSGSSTNVYLCYVATSGCDPANDIGVTGLSTGSPWTSGSLSGTSQYQLVVDNTGSGSAANFTVTTTTTAAPAYGLPSGTTNISVSGTANGITRKLESTVPAVGHRQGRKSV